MYTTQKIRKAAAVIDQVAEMHGVSRLQVCEALQSVIESGRNNAASSEKSIWNRFHFAGAAPTAEELILWAASLVREKRIGG